MSFKILNNISFKEKFSLYISIFSVVAVCVTVLVMFVIFTNKSTQIVEKSKGEVYVMVDDLVLKAIRSNDFKESTDASAKGALLLFHNYFWSLEPYEEYINENHGKAFDMSDGTVKQLRKYLNGQRFYNNILSGQYSTRLVMKADNIQIDYTKKPFKFVAQGKLLVYRKDDVVTHNLFSEGELEQRGNADNNFTGFFIKNYKVTDFEVIKTEKNES